MDRILLVKLSQKTLLTLTEDIEQTAAITAEGEKIHFCQDAVFYDEQPVRFRDFFYQRLRWCKGNHQMFSLYGYSLLLSLMRHPTATKWGILTHIVPIPAITFIWFTLYALIGAIYAVALSVPVSVFAEECLMFCLANFGFSFLMVFFCGAIHFCQYYHEIEAPFLTK